MMEGASRVLRVLWELLVRAARTVGNFALFILMLPLVIVMMCVFAAYAFVDWIRLWVERTFAESEQKTSCAR